MTRSIVTTLVLLLCASRVALADPAAPDPATEGPGTQTDTTSDPAEDALTAQLVVDGVPDIPALEILSNSDLKVVRPGSVKAAATELRAFYKGGKLVTGMAVELTPWSLWLAQDTTYEDYVGNYWNRLLARMSLSVATVASGAEGSGDVSAGAGLRIRLWDGADWRLNSQAIECALKALPLDEPGEAPPDEEPAAAATPTGNGAATGLVVTSGTPATDAELEAVGKCLKDHIKWNASQGAAGVAVKGSFAGGKVKEGDYDALSVWASFTIPLGVSGRWLITPRYTHHDDGIDETMAAVPTFQTIGVGTELEFKTDSLLIVAEGGLATRLGKDPSGSWQIEHWVGLVGLDTQFKIRDGLWLDFEVSADLGQGGTVLGLSNLKWSHDILPDRVEPERRLKPGSKKPAPPPPTPPPDTKVDPAPPSNPAGTEDQG